MDCMCTAPGTNNMPVGGHSKENLDFRSRCPWRNGSSSQICWGGQFQTSQVQFQMIFIDFSYHVTAVQFQMIFHIMSQRKTHPGFPAGKVPLINSQRLLVAARGWELVSKRLWSLMGTSMTLGAPTALDQKNWSMTSWGSWHFFITSARSGLLTLAHRRSSKGNPLWVCYLDIINYLPLLKLEFPEDMKIVCWVLAFIHWLRTPCLTRARSGGDAFWVTSHGRFLNLKDWIHFKPQYFQIARCIINSRLPPITPIVRINHNNLIPGPLLNK